MTQPYAANYRKIGDTTFDVWESEFNRVHSPLLPQIDAMYPIAQPHSALCLAQMWIENKYATTGHIIAAKDNNPLSLRPWENDPHGLPQGAIGVIYASDGGQFLKFATAADCIREWKRRLFDDPAYKGGVYVNAMSLKQMIDVYAPPGDVHPITGVDNADSGYYDTVTTKLKQFMNQEETEESIMTTYVKHVWPGLENPVWLPDTLKASVQLISSSVAGWTSGTKSSQHTTFTQHFTGNMNSSAQSERDWAAGGGRAKLNPPSPGSYQIIVDGTEVIVAQRFDEMAGHAANNTGNFTSLASEMAIKGGYEKAFQNAAHVAAGVIVAKDWQVDTALLKHQSWKRADGTFKYCPSIILDKGDWSRYVATVSNNASAIRAFLAGGETPKPTPIYAVPVVIPELAAVSKADGIAPSWVDASETRWFWVGDRVQAKVATGRFQRASKASDRLGPDLKPGEEFEVDWVTDYEGSVWFYTPYATRICGEDVERISDVKSAEAA